MDQKWQVCELEESNNISLSLFERYSVVSVPEGWISVLADGTMVCFWPSVDTQKKIRSLHRPKADEKGVYYKCRILLDGAKFSKYKEAKQAELIAQNVSSINDTSVLSGGLDAVNVCESSMHFDVSDAGSEETDNKASSENCDFDVMSDDGNNDFVGNDSFEFNKRMLERSYFSRRASAMTFEVSNIEDECLPKGANQTFPEICGDYSTTFNGDNFLTSTVIDDSEFVSGVKRAKVFDALPMITAVELKLKSFLGELNKLKENLQGMENAGDAPYVRPSAASSDIKKNIGDPELASADALTKGNEARSSDESDECFLEYQPIDTSLEEILIEDVSDNIRIINKTFVVEPVHVNDTSNVQRPEIPTNQDVPVAENAPIDAKVSEAFGIEEKLPIDKVEDYKRNEYLLELDEDDFKAYLITRLTSLELENEPSYMNRTILVVFTPNFFLDSVSWKKETNRINIKNGNLFCCWMECYRKKFDPKFDPQAKPNDDDLQKFSKVFQDHFRRVKAALRAANKSELKRKQNGNAKSNKK